MTFKKQLVLKLLTLSFKIIKFYKSESLYELPQF